ncbi:hypothetical protein C3V43_09870 [Bacteroides heparinolyticus]|nr:hypothetical protein C3V43_09870 [Bacteroides heparinolyticus]
MRAYPLREILAGGFWWRYISTVLHVYMERAAFIFPAGDIYIASRGEEGNSLISNVFFFS